MSKHTKEPWFWSSDYGEISFISKEDDQSYGMACPVDINDKDNARRIVACVNACAGIPTEELEEQVSKGRLIKLSECMSCTQRDELLAELKEALRLLEADAPNHAMDTIYSAIAKAEGV